MHSPCLGLELHSATSRLSNLTEWLTQFMRLRVDIIKTYYYHVAPERASAQLGVCRGSGVGPSVTAHDFATVLTHKFVKTFCPLCRVAGTHYYR